MPDRLLRPRVVAGVCAAAIVVGALAILLPALLRAHAATSSTPVRRDLVAHDVALAGGQRVCVANVPFDRDSAVARLWVRRAPDGGALRVVATAPRYRARGDAVLAPTQATTGGTAVDVRLTPPATATAGTLCATNAGTGRIALVGTDQARAVERTSAALDGTPLRQAPSLSLLQARERSVLARTGELLDRAAALGPFGPWLLWTLLPLVALGVPALVVTALLRAMQDPARPDAGER